jgi:hypothetical protein
MYLGTEFMPPADIRMSSPVISCNKLHRPGTKTLPKRSSYDIKFSMAKKTEFGSHTSKTSAMYTEGSMFQKLIYTLLIYL